MRVWGRYVDGNLGYSFLRTGLDPIFYNLDVIFDTFAWNCFTLSPDFSHFELFSFQIGRLSRSLWPRRINCPGIFTDRLIFVKNIWTIRWNYPRIIWNSIGFGQVFSAPNEKIRWFPISSQRIRPAHFLVVSSWIIRLVVLSFIEEQRTPAKIQLCIITAGSSSAEGQTSASWTKTWLVNRGDKKGQ